MILFLIFSIVIRRKTFHMKCSCVLSERGTMSLWRHYWVTPYPEVRQCRLLRAWSTSCTWPRRPPSRRGALRPTSMHKRLHWRRGRTGSRLRTSTSRCRGRRWRGLGNRPKNWNATKCDICKAILCFWTIPSELTNSPSLLPITGRQLEATVEHLPLFLLLSYYFFLISY